MDFFPFLEAGGKVAIFFVPFLLSLCIHEFSHAYVALKKGDETALNAGRLTLNPLPHMDILGTLILPLMGLLSGWNLLFGWAKPVPVDIRNLKDPKKDMFWIALAGPASNLILAFLGSFLFALVHLFEKSFPLSTAMGALLNSFIYINILLAIFNFIPLHPLDGGKILARFLSPSANHFLEKNQGAFQIGLILFFILGGFRYLLTPMIFLHSLFVKIAIVSLSFLVP